MYILVFIYSIHEFYCNLLDFSHTGSLGRTAYADNVFCFLNKAYYYYPIPRSDLRRPINISWWMVSKLGGAQVQQHKQRNMLQVIHIFRIFIESKFSIKKILLIFLKCVNHIGSLFRGYWGYLGALGLFVGHCGFSRRTFRENLFSLIYIYIYI